MKNFFIDGATLSFPQSDTADNVARGFLRQHASLFALSEVTSPTSRNQMRTTIVGTTFEICSDYRWIKVFEGNVKVAVNRNGEVLSVREGFLVSGIPVKLKGAMNERKGIAKALEYAGAPGEDSLVETHSRASKGEMSRFANPVSANNEDVLSELNVVRIGDEARLAWHVFAEVGKNAWYELLVDAHTGELLLRHNLYVDAAQGTVYVEAPDKGARQLLFSSAIRHQHFGRLDGHFDCDHGNNVEAYLDTDANNFQTTITERDSPSVTLRRPTRISRSRSRPPSTRARSRRRL